MNEYSAPKPLFFVSKTVGYGTFQVALGCLIIAVLILYAKWHWGRRKLYIYASKRNGPFAWPFIGNAFRFYGNNEQILNSLSAVHKNRVSPVRIWLAHRLFFACNKPEDLEIILNSQKSMEKEELYKYAATYMGNGLFTGPVHIWKRHRKLIAPTFNQKILDSFLPMILESGQVFVEILKEDLKTARNGEVDIYDRISRCTMDTICETAMGQKINTQRSDNDVGEKIERGMQIVFQRMFKIWFHSDFIFNLTKMASEEKVISEKLNILTHQMISTKKEEYRLKKKEMGEHPEAEVDSEKSNRRKVFLDFLIEQNVFTDEELRDETLTFLVAGSDTTATVDSFIFTSLGINQDVQQKVYEEVMDIVGPSRDIEIQDLPNLKYLERVVKETMRFFPIGPNIVRRITEDLEVTKNVMLPAGSSAIISVFDVHHNEKHWPDPWKFDPDRFLPEVTAKRHPYAYLPFSAGPRNCIGMKYAYMGLKTLIAMSVRTFRIESDYKDMKSVRCKQDVIIKPVLGYKVRLYER